MNTPFSGSDDHGLAWFQGNIIPANQAALPLLTHALHYATCCIEGIRTERCVGGWSVLQLTGHLARLERNARILGLNPPSAAAMRSAVSELLRATPWTGSSYLRPLVFQAGTMLGPNLRPADTAFACIIRPMPRRTLTGPGMKLHVSSWRRMDESAIPSRLKASAGYLTAALAREEAARAGCDDAILLDALGHVSESTAANLLLVRQGVLIAPAYGTAQLEGLTQQVVQAAARAQGIEIHARTIARGELACAEEILLCGTAIELGWAGWLDGKSLMTGHQGPGPIAARILAEWDAARSAASEVVQDG